MSARITLAALVLLGAACSSGAPESHPLLGPAMAGRAAAGDDTSITPGAGGGSSDTAAPYANVTAVTTSGSEGAYTFSVSVESADIDCSQYADWWEIVGEDGTLVYRRILDHSHTDANGTTDPDAPGNTFTRSSDAPVPVGADTTVIVRAHISVGGYSGRAMRGSPAGGFAQALDIGADFAPDLEHAPPQPTDCTL